MTALEAGGNGQHACCYREHRFDGLDVAVGRCMAETSAARAAAERTTDEVLEIREEMRQDRATRAREWEMMRDLLRSMTGRITRLEAHDDAQDDEPDTGIMSREELVADRSRVRDEADASVRKARIQAIVGIVGVIVGAVVTVALAWVQR